MRVIKGLKSWINGYDEVKILSDELELAFDFVKDEIITEEEVDKLYERTIRKLDDLELKNMLRQEEDQLGAVLKVNAGAGGTEAQDWVEILVRMYEHWSEKSGYKATMIDFLNGDDAGLKSAVLLIEGINAYGFLKSEKIKTNGKDYFEMIRNAKKERKDIKFIGHWCLQLDKCNNEIINCKIN